MYLSSNSGHSFSSKVTILLTVMKSVENLSRSNCIFASSFSILTRFFTEWIDLLAGLVWNHGIQFQSFAYCFSFVRTLLKPGISALPEINLSLKRIKIIERCGILAWDYSLRRINLSFEKIFPPNYKKFCSNLRYRSFAFQNYDIFFFIQLVVTRVSTCAWVS